MRDQHCAQGHTACRWWSGEEPQLLLTQPFLLPNAIWGPPIFSGLKIRQEVVFHKNCHPFLPPCLGWVSVEPRCPLGIDLHSVALLSCQTSGETQAYVPMVLHTAWVLLLHCAGLGWKLGPGALPPSEALWGLGFTLQDDTAGRTRW